MTQYIDSPYQQNVKIVVELDPDCFYTLPRGQTLAFPFELSGHDMIRVDAGHTSFYDNQQGTISAWASDEINGRTITSSPNSNLGRVQLQGDGFNWQFYDITRKLILPDANLTQWIQPDKKYYMCFQNLENKDNGLYVKFAFIDT